MPCITYTILWHGIDLQTIKLEYIKWQVKKINHTTVSKCGMVVYAKNVVMIKPVKTRDVHYGNGGLKMYCKHEIDEQAEREGQALKHQGKYKQSRYRWIRLQAEHKQAIEKKHFRS